MSAVATCPGCRQNYHVPDGDDRPIPCPGCGQALRRQTPPVEVVPPARPRRGPGRPAMTWWITMLILNGVGLAAAFLGSATASPGGTVTLTAPLWASAWFLFVYTTGRTIERIVTAGRPD